MNNTSLKLVMVELIATYILLGSFTYETIS